MILKEDEIQRVAKRKISGFQDALIDGKQGTGNFVVDHGNYQEEAKAQAAAKVDAYKERKR